MVTVIVPHYGPDSLLVACKAALGPDVPVVVWDGNTANHGFAGNCNRAAEGLTGHLIFLNNDTIPQPGWLDPLTAALDAGHPIAGSHLTYPDGTNQHTGVAVARLPHAVHAINATNTRPSGPVDAVTGACLAITADLFWALGGFDEGYWNGYEDIDLCLAATEKTGRRPWYCADSHVVHLESVSDPEQRFIKARHNQARLSEKWGTR